MWGAGAGWGKEDGWKPSLGNQRKQQCFSVRLRAPNHPGVPDGRACPSALLRWPSL